MALLTQISLPILLFSLFLFSSSLSPSLQSFTPNQFIMACRYPMRNQNDNRRHRRKQTQPAFTYNDSEEVSSPEWKFIDMTEQEEDLIDRMYKLVGDRWPLIAGRVPGRTPEEIERYWIMKNAEWFACRRIKRQKPGKTLSKEY